MAKVETKRGEENRVGSDNKVEFSDKELGQFRD